MKSPVSSTAQLADLLGLSRCTVSRALNSHEAVSPKTAARVKEAADLHGFSPNILGRGLRSGKTNLIGICLPPIVEYALTQKVSRMHHAIEARGFHPVMQMTDGSKRGENAALESFAAMRCAAVFMIASHLEATAAGMRSLEARKIPAVMIDPVYPTTHQWVSTDRAFAMGIALEHFHQLGHRQLVLMGFQKAGAYSPQRIAGFQKGCKKLGWSFERDIVFMLHPLVEVSDFAAGFALAEEYLALPQAERIPAIFAINDNVALGAIHYLKSKGIRIPEDISIMGSDNAAFSSYVDPALTSLDFQPTQLIDNALELLPATAMGHAPSQDPISVCPQLVVRKSTAAPPAL
ncbi:MAG: LacI family DNA-binding transcriptional regulator [Chthoniobacterales bacterium]